MSDKRELGMGNVPIKLIDEHGHERELVLKPSLHAMRTLSRRYGGLQGIVDRIGKLDWDVIVDVVEVGLQIPASPKARAELEQSIYASGISDQTSGIPTLVIDYVTILMHGGRRPEDVGSAAPQPNPPHAS